jgi:hypothetical protein
MSTTQQHQYPKLGFFSIAFICLLTITAIVAPYLFVNSYTSFVGNLPQPPATYTTSNFSDVFGNAENDGNMVSNIGANSGFRFTVNSKNATSAKFSIEYKGENQSGILKVNGYSENLFFIKTNRYSNSDWQTKEVIVQLNQGANNIEF